MQSFPLVVAAVAFAVLPASAQQSASPYAGLAGREIKSLGPDDVTSLLAGEGMRMALAAELNHFPGPRHVLDLADDLGLTDTQRRAVETVSRRMQQAAVRLGQAVVEREAALDRAFALGTIDEEQLRELVQAIARLQGDLRAVHLAAHLETKRLLSTQQVRRYDELRGYGSAGPGGGQGHGGHGRHGP